MNCQNSPFPLFLHTWPFCRRELCSQTSSGLWQLFILSLMSTNPSQSHAFTLHDSSRSYHIMIIIIITIHIYFIAGCSLWQLLWQWWWSCPSSESAEAGRRSLELEHLCSGRFTLAQTFCTFGKVSLTQYSWLKILLQSRFSWTGPPWSTPPTRTSRTTRAPPRSSRRPWETTTFVSTILRTFVELNETFKLLRILIRTLCTGAFNETTRKVELSLPRSALPSVHSVVPDDLTYKMRPDTAHVVGRDYARYTKYFVWFSIYPLTDLSQCGPGLTSSDPVLPLNRCTDRCIPGLLPCHRSRLSQDLTSPGLWGKFFLRS